MPELVPAAASSLYSFSHIKASTFSVFSVLVSCSHKYFGRQIFLITENSAHPVYSFPSISYKSNLNFSHISRSLPFEVRISFLSRS